MSQSDSVILFWFTLFGGAGLVILGVWWLDTWIRTKRAQRANAAHLAKWLQVELRNRRPIK